jgi:lipid-A-disaccharide synthase
VAKRLFFVAGELSGDNHGAGLMRALREQDADLELSGLGGSQMREIAEGIEDWLAEAAVLGIWEVLKKYSYFKNKMAETVTRVIAELPDAVVLIDYPGFNLRLAKALREVGYEGRLIFYISPQVWAWKKGRVKAMAKLLDRMICIFPFEKELYESSGLETNFAGHPLVDSLEKKRDSDIEREDDLVALLPGSREREVEVLFAPMIGAARKLRKAHPNLRFATAAANEALAKRMREIADEGGLGDLEFASGGVHDLMQRAGTGVVASGTATLEAAYFGLPYCLVYRVAWPTYVLGKMLVQVDFLGIVNILAGREVVRELLQGEASAEGIAAELGRLLDDDGARQKLRDDLAETVARLGGGGAYRAAAEAVLDAAFGAGQS